MDIFKTISVIVVMFLVLWAGLMLLNVLMMKIIMLIFDLEHKFDSLTATSIIASSATNAVILVSILYGQGAFN